MILAKRSHLRIPTWFALLGGALISLSMIGLALYSRAYAQQCKTQWELVHMQAHKLCKMTIAPTLEYAQQAHAWLEQQKTLGLTTNPKSCSVPSEDSFLKLLQEQSHEHAVHLAQAVIHSKSFNKRSRQDIDPQVWGALQALVEVTLTLKPWELAELEYLTQGRWKIAYKGSSIFAHQWILALAKLPYAWTIETLHIHTSKNSKAPMLAPLDPGIVLETILYWQPCPCS